MELDRYDRAILRLLQQDARITNTPLAEKVSLSESACLRRVRALEESGLIQGYTALIDQQKAGYPVNVFVSITLDRQSQSGLEAFENAVRKIPEVMECYLMTGEHDYLLRLVVPDLADFERIHNQHLTRLPSVARVQSSFAMRTVTRSVTLPKRRPHRAASSAQPRSKRGYRSAAQRSAMNALPEGSCGAAPPPLLPGSDTRKQLRGRHRSAAVEPLEMGAPQMCERLELLGRLDPLGDLAQIQALGHGHNGARDRRTLADHEQAADEARSIFSRLSRMRPGSSA